MKGEFPRTDTLFGLSGCVFPLAMVGGDHASLGEATESRDRAALVDLTEQLALAVFY